MSDLHDELAKLGWSGVQNDAWQQARRAPAQIPARVVRQERGWLSLDTGRALLRAVSSGRLRHEAASAADLPVIGDWVVIGDEGGGSEQPVTITELLPRQSVLLRRRAGGTSDAQPLAANIDLALVVVALDHEPSLPLIERAIVLARAGGVEPVVILNKADLCPEREAQTHRVRAHLPDLRVLAVSAAVGDGTQALPSLIGPRRTATLLGPSGVGKSSLVNRLLGSDVMQTGAVRSEDRKGRHTTTHRQLLTLPSGSLLIDGPGVRELGVWGAQDAVEAGFPDVVEAASRCLRRACQHATESGCAVQAALRKRELSVERVNGYLKLLHEIRATKVTRRRGSPRHRS